MYLSPLQALLATKDKIRRIVKWDFLAPFRAYPLFRARKNIYDKALKGFGKSLSYKFQLQVKHLVTRALTDNVLWGQRTKGFILRKDF